MGVWQYRWNQPVKAWRERMDWYRECWPLFKWALRIYSLPVIFLVSPSLATALAERWSAPAIARLATNWFKTHPESLTRFQQMQLSEDQQALLQRLAGSPVYTAVLVGAASAATQIRTEGRQNLVDKISDIADRLTPEQIDEALQGAATLMDDPVSAHYIRQVPDDVVVEIDAALSSATMSPDERQARRNLLLSLIAFFSVLLVLQGSAVVQPEWADEIGEAEQHLEVAALLASAVLFALAKKWRPPQ
jgi:hypothetical protein